MPRITRHPTAVLVGGTWNDFGYETLFEVYFYLFPRYTWGSIGFVKILHATERDTLKVIPRVFTRLGKDFSSLGQDVDYYNKVAQFPRQRLRAQFLGALRDVTVDPKALAAFRKHEGFQNSLLRTSSARAAFDQRRKKFSREFKPIFTFRVAFPGADAALPVEFSFRADDRLPARANILIGRNGTGKTSFLAYLAIALTGLGSKRAPSPHGSFVGDPPAFTKIIAVSYNPFDEFPLPGEHAGGKAIVRRTGGLLGYVYCGLRDTLRHGGSSRVTLKSQFDIRRDLNAAMRTLSVRRQLKDWHELVAPVLRAAGIPDSDNDPTSLRERFRDLSSGQKIVLLVLAQTYMQLAPKSIVLFDEPENHLHPTLLVEFLHAFRRILEARDSYAVIATHSPVVLQETPSRFVRVFARFEDTPILRSLENECFGEAIGQITTEIFGVNPDLTDYHTLLNEWMDEGLSVSRIERLLGKPLSLNARSYVLRRTTKDEQ